MRGARGAQEAQGGRRSRAAAGGAEGARGVVLDEDEEEESLPKGPPISAGASGFPQGCGPGRCKEAARLAPERRTQCQGGVAPCPASKLFTPEVLFCTFLVLCFSCSVLFLFCTLQ